MLSQNDYSTDESGDASGSPMISWTAHQHQAHETRERVDFEMIYVDMTGDLMAGLVLAQIDYWHSLGRNGKPRLRIKRDGHLWLAKARHEWWDEIRVSPKQADRALDILVKLGFIEKHIWRFAGSPTVHVRIIPEAFMAAYNQMLVTASENPYCPKGENGNCPKGEIEIDESGESLTETTTETTTEDTPKGADAPVEGPPPIKGKGAENPTSFQGWLGLLKEAERGTKQATNTARVSVILRMYRALYPDGEWLDAARVAKVANEIGGWSLLAKGVWEQSTRPPVGDLLSYLTVAHVKEKQRGNGNGRRGTNGRAQPSNRAPDQPSPELLKELEELNRQTFQRSGIEVGHG